MVDIDGVISLFGEPGHTGLGTPPPGAPPLGTPALGAPAGSVSGSFHSIEGIPHFLSSTAAAHLLTLAGFFELVWASGWEEKANEYLPRLLGLPAGLPFLRFARDGGRTGPTQAHWKLASIERLRGRAPAGVDRRRLQPRLPGMGRRAPVAHAAREHRARARAHLDRD